MSRYHLGQRASEDLDAIWDYHARYSVASARRFLKKLEKTLQNLADMPTLGADASALHRSLKVFTVKKHVIFYLPADDGIRVLRLLSGWREAAAIDWEAEDTA